MTTPRDAISGLSERLRADVGQRDIYRTDATLLEAATQLDSLLKERDVLRQILSECATAIGNGAMVSPECSVEFMALLPKEIAARTDAMQERVKELEGELVDTQAALTGVNSDWAKAESRALRAEQERDEAVAALKPFAKTGKLFLPRSFGDYDQCIYAPAAGPEYNLTGDHLRAARDLVRRLSAGPEKDGV